MKKIFITATNTNVGKTFSSLKLIEELSNQGFRVGAIKPFESGVENSRPLDGEKLLQKIKLFNSKLKNFTIEDIVPYQFELPASIYVAKKEKKIDFDIVEKAIKKFEPFCDILIIEGAGGLLVPIEKNFFIIDLIEYLKIDKTLLITSSELGSRNNTLLSLEALKNRDINYDWIINLYLDKKEFFEITYPFYKDYFKNSFLLDRDLEKLTKNLLKLQ